jgi:hypothetical protein
MIQSLLRLARRAALPVVLSCAAPVALAGSVTVFEYQLDDIFAQAGIDIRVDAAQTVVNGAWTQMDYADFNAASSYITAPGHGLSARTIPVFFIDDFNNDVSASTAGLGWLGQRFLAVESNHAANALYGSTLLAHEMAHNLGLEHASTAWNLMLPTLDGQGRNNVLLADQITTILGSSLVQTDSFGQRFIEIAPFAVVAAPVPEPTTWAMLLGGLALVGAARRRA